MNTSNFDIAGRDLSMVDWMSCRLVVEVSNHYLYYIVLEGQDSFVALKYYSFIINNNFELTSALEGIYRDDEVLRHKMKEQVVIYNSPENCLVPQKHFDGTLNKNIIEMLHGDLHKGMILSEKVYGWNLFNVYRIPPEMHDFFENNFPGTKYYHYYSLWLECRYRDENNTADRVTVIFYPNEIVAIVFAGGQLQVIQCIKFQTVEDIAWQLLNMYAIYHLDQQQTPLVVGGMVDLESAMFDVLLRYFAVIETDLLPAQLQGADYFKSFPPHFFAPFIKLAVCVS